MYQNNHNLGSRTHISIVPLIPLIFPTLKSHLESCLCDILIEVCTKHIANDFPSVSFLTQILHKSIFFICLWITTTTSRCTRFRRHDWRWRLTVPILASPLHTLHSLWMWEDIDWGISWWGLGGRAFHTLWRWSYRRSAGRLPQIIVRVVRGICIVDLIWCGCARIFTWERCGDSKALGLNNWVVDITVILGVDFLWSIAYCRAWSNWTVYKTDWRESIRVCHWRRAVCLIYIRVWVWRLKIQCDQRMCFNRCN